MEKPKAKIFTFCVSFNKDNVQRQEKKLKTHSPCEF